MADARPSPDYIRGQRDGMARAADIAEGRRRTGTAWIIRAAAAKLPEAPEPSGVSFRIIWDHGEELRCLSKAEWEEFCARIPAAMLPEADGLEPPGCPIPGACACPGGEAELAKRLAAMTERCRVLEAENAALRAERERLRAVLCEIRDCQLAISGTSERQTIARYRETARAALAAEGSKP